MSAPDPAWFGLSGLAGATALAVTSVIRGWLVPARRVDKEQGRINDDHTREVARLDGDCTYWRAAYERERDRADVAARQLDTLSNQYGATMHVFASAALPPQSPTGGGSGVRAAD